MEKIVKKQKYQIWYKKCWFSVHTYSVAEPAVAGTFSRKQEPVWRSGTGSSLDEKEKILNATYSLRSFQHWLNFKGK